MKGVLVIFLELAVEIKRTSMELTVHPGQRNTFQYRYKKNVPSRSKAVQQCEHYKATTSTHCQTTQK